MSRYMGDALRVQTEKMHAQRRAIERLQAEAEIADQIIEDKTRALEDSERVCDRYREALLEIDQYVGLKLGINPVGQRVRTIVEDAMWTKVDR